MALSSKISKLYFEQLSKAPITAPLDSLNGTSFFLTGGTGFIGSWLLHFLYHINTKSIDVKVSVLSRSPSTFLKKFPIFIGLPWLKFIEGDVVDFATPKERYDYIIHAATETSALAHSNHKKMLDTIILGTQKVCEMAKKCEAKRVLMISSGAVYGSQPADLFSQPETSLLACDPLQPHSAYGEGKRLMELMGAILEKEAKIKVISARCFSFCGPGLPLSGHYAFGNFIRDAMSKKTILVNGNGSAVRSYLNGSDMARWLFITLLRGNSGQAYNIGSDEPISVLELAKKAQALIAPNKQIIVLGRENSSNEFSNRYVPNINKVRELGCKVWTNLDDGILGTAAYSSLLATSD